MAAHDYIPTKDKAFFEFQKIFLLNTKDNLVKWNIPKQEFEELAAVASVFVPAYQKNENVLTRTKATTRDHRSKRTKLVKALRNFIQQRVARNNAINIEELTGLGLKPRKQNHTRKAAIDSSPELFIGLIQSGRMRVMCRQQNHSGRAALHPLCHALELKYSTGTEFPASPDDCNNTFVITKASFTLQLNMKEIGKFMYAFARWKNLSDDSRSGPWCLVKRSVIG